MKNTGNNTTQKLLWHLYIIMKGITKEYRKERKSWFCTDSNWQNVAYEANAVSIRPTLNRKLGSWLMLMVCVAVEVASGANLVNLVSFSVFETENVLILWSSYNMWWLIKCNWITKLAYLINISAATLIRSVRIQLSKLIHRKSENDQFKKIKNKRYLNVHLLYFFSWRGRVLGGQLTKMYSGGSRQETRAITN